MQEYHDGILLFTIMEEMVWNKAMADTLGLEAYYKSKPDLFKWGEHFDGMIIECQTAEARQKTDEVLATGETDPFVITGLINTAENENLVKINKGRWEKGDNAIVNYYIWSAEKPSDLDEALVFVNGKVLASANKNLFEARGLYVSEYQDFLEKEWVKQLRSKYPVKVNKKLLKKVKPVSK
jgi:peptidyl-prolyl cis-trans isomerase SurA